MLHWSVCLPRRKDGPDENRRPEPRTTGPCGAKPLFEQGSRCGANLTILGSPELDFLTRVFRIPRQDRPRPRRPRPRRRPLIFDDPDLRNRPFLSLRRRPDPTRPAAASASASAPALQRLAPFDRQVSIAFSRRAESSVPSRRLHCTAPRRRPVDSKRRLAAVDLHPPHSLAPHSTPPAHHVEQEE